MCLHIRAQFDGRALIPDQPVDLPVNQPLELEVTAGNQVKPSPAEIKERLHKLEEFFQETPLAEIPLESLRRENLYEDRA